MKNEYMYKIVIWYHMLGTDLDFKTTQHFVGQSLTHKFLRNARKSVFVNTAMAKYLKEEIYICENGSDFIERSSWLNIYKGTKTDNLFEEEKKPTIAYDFRLLDDKVILEFRDFSNTIKDFCDIKNYSDRLVEKEKITYVKILRNFCGEIEYESEETESRSEILKSLDTSLKLCPSGWFQVFEITHDMKTGSTKYKTIFDNNRCGA